MQRRNDLIIISQDQRFKSQVSKVAPPVLDKQLLIIHDDGTCDITAVISELTEQTDRSTIILCSYHSFSSLIPLLETQSLCHYIRLGTPDWARTLRRIINHLSVDQTCSIASSHLIYSAEIRFKSDINQAKEEIEHLCAARTISATLTEKVILCYIEAVNNALYHGFKESGTEPKYYPETFHGLYDDDTLKVFLSIDENEVTLSVEDNGGNLTPDRILQSWARNSVNSDDSPSNTDTRGRGLYIIANCVSLMEFHTCEGSKSQLVLTFARNCSEFHGFSIKK